MLTGSDMVISDSGVEALIVPIELTYGKLEINVAIKEKN